MKDVPTHVAPPHDMSKVMRPALTTGTLECPRQHDTLQDAYVALNKPTSVDHWLKNAKASTSQPRHKMMPPPHRPASNLHRFLAGCWRHCGSA